MAENEQQTIVVGAQDHSANNTITLLEALFILWKRRYTLCMFLAAGAIIILCAAIITVMSVAAAHEPIPLVAIIWLIGAPAVTIVLTVIVLVQRIREIRKGEAYDARNY